MALGAGMITVGVIAGEEDGGTPPPVIGGGDISLVAYDSCDTALAEMKNRIMPHVGPYGLGPGGRIFTDGMPMDAESAEGAGKAAGPAAGPGGATRHSRRNTRRPTSTRPASTSRTW